MTLVPFIEQKAKQEAQMGILPQLGQNPFSGSSGIVIFMFCATFSSPEPKAPGELIV